MNVVGKSVRRAIGVSMACGGLLAVSSCVPMVGGATVEVELDEFTVTPDPASAPAGAVTFHVVNVGADAHEFLVIKTDLAPDALPTGADGHYEENGPGTEIVDEIDFIPAGEDGELTINLEAGSYVLICNFGQAEGHYAKGMHAAFTVE